MSRLYVLDKWNLTVEEYEVVKETSKRYYCKTLGPYSVGRHFNKLGWIGPVDTLFTDPVEALVELNGLMVERIRDLEERRRHVECERERIISARLREEGSAV